MNILARIFRKITVIFLDILSVPSLFLRKKWNAKYHLKVVCPLCPTYRRKLRCVLKNGKCWWFEQWKKGNYYIPRSFGFKNYVRTMLGKKTKLKKYKLRILRKK